MRSGPSRCGCGLGFPTRLFGEARFFSLRFRALLRFELRCFARLFGFACCPLCFHFRGERSGLAPLHLWLVHAKVPSSADAQDEERCSGEDPRMEALALLRLNRSELALVIELTTMRLGLFRRFLFEPHAKLGGFALSLQTLVFFLLAAELGLTCFLFCTAPRFFLFLLASGLGGDSFPLRGLALEPLCFFIAYAILFEAHQLAQIEENRRLFFLGHRDTYITLLHWIRTRASALFFSASQTLSIRPNLRNLRDSFCFQRHWNPSRRIVMADVI